MKYTVKVTKTYVCSEPFGMAEVFGTMEVEQTARVMPRITSIV